MSHHTGTCEIVLEAHIRALTPWITLQTTSQAMIARLATLCRLRCRGRTKIRRATHVKDRMVSSTCAMSAREPCSLGEAGGQFFSQAGARYDHRDDKNMGDRACDVIRAQC